MILIATNDKKQQLAIGPILGVRLNGSFLEVSFPDETMSMGAFKKIREHGIKCTHVGKNAPGGPMLFFSLNRNEYQLKFT